MKLELNKKEQDIYRKFKPYLWTIPFVFSIFLIILIFFKILIPLGLNFLGIFLGITELWISLEDINFKFIGAIFFFLVFWKLFTILSYIFMKILESAIEFFNINFERSKKVKNESATSKKRRG